PGGPAGLGDAHAGAPGRPPAVVRARGRARMPAALGRLSGMTGQFETPTSTTRRSGMAADTFQAVTGALYPSGLQAYIQHFGTTTYPSQLNGRGIPDDSFTADRIPLGPGGRIENFKAQLSNGAISGATAQFNSVTSQGGGKFTLVLTVAANVNFGSWHETG